MNTWHGDEPLAAPKPVGLGGWIRVGLRGSAILVTLLAGFALMLALRLVERPLFSPARPITPWITVAVCRVALRVAGLRLRVTGSEMTERGAVVANHASWLDILVLNARRRVYFVAKAEVAGWPGINWLAKATGTVFIRRDRREARTQVALFRRRLCLGHRLLFFPEGTSTDGRRVLPFKTTLFAAFFDPDLHRTMSIQPVTVFYRAPPGEDARFYGWWGEMDLGPSLVKVLSQRRQGTVQLSYHPSLKVADYADRKALARALEEAVRAPLARAVAREDPA